MMYLASPHTAVELAIVREAAATAARTAPTALAYAVMGDAATAAGDHAGARAFLAEERARLDALAGEGDGDFALAQARLGLARVETALATHAADRSAVSRAQEALATRNAEMRALLTKWAYGWDPNVF
jgi:hypothetical protein